MIDWRWIVPIAVGAIAFGFSAWVWFQAGEDRQRLTNLEDELHDMWTWAHALEEALGTPVVLERPESPQDALKPPPGSTDNPERDPQRGTEALSGSTAATYEEHIEALRAPQEPETPVEWLSHAGALPPVPPTVAMRSVRRDEPEPEPFEPETNPQTQPAIERRGRAGRWVEGPGGSLVYQQPGSE